MKESHDHGTHNDIEGTSEARLEQNPECLSLKTACVNFCDFRPKHYWESAFKVFCVACKALCSNYLGDDCRDKLPDKESIIC